MQIATIILAQGLRLQDETLKTGDSNSLILLPFSQITIDLPYGLSECKGFCRKVAAFSALRVEEQRKHVLQTK